MKTCNVIQQRLEKERRRQKMHNFWFQLSLTLSRGRFGRNTLNFIVFSFRRTRTKRPALELMGLGRERRRTAKCKNQKPVNLFHAIRGLLCSEFFFAKPFRFAFNEITSSDDSTFESFRLIEDPALSRWRFERPNYVCMQPFSGRQQSFCRHDKLCFSLLALRKTLSQLSISDLFEAFSCF